jgi:hypothetical protein
MTKKKLVPKYKVKSLYQKNSSVKRASELEFVEEHWFVNHWRPAMAWSYMAICLFDFIIAPSATSWLITFYHSSIPVWKALTLDGGGLIHIAFGAILGVSAWGRTKEAVINTEVQSGGMGLGLPYSGNQQTTITDTQYSARPQQKPAPVAPPVEEQPDIIQPVPIRPNR